MKATESPLLGLLKGPRQFLIPIYQRSYSWTEEQCAQLWEDVQRVAQDDRYPAHFIGSVVYIEHGLYQATSVPQLLVIDGQQRLTTVTLLIEALARAVATTDASEAGDITERKLRNYFLFNAEEDGALRYKLQLSQGDADTLRAVLGRKELPEEPARRVLENFEYFQEQIEESDVSPSVLYHGLGKLLVVDVALDRDRDNPQLIFESLNSTGLDLSQSDLIRNYVLMGLGPAEQDSLYTDHWRRIERILARGGRDDSFDRFLRAWLTLRLGEVPNLRRGYETFKRYRAMHPDQPIHELVQDLHRCAEYYGAIALGHEEHPELSKVFRGLRDLRVDSPMPLLLHAYSLWKQARVNDEDMVCVARLIESWLFRRAVCDIPSNVLSRTFATMPENLKDGSFRESLEAYLLLRTGRQRFPRDEEFRAALVSRNLYEFKHRQYCLTRLENTGRKEPVDIGEYQVEHILPQNEKLAPEWREMLGDDWRSIQERWLHTLGNLTLTGYNPELSDRPFLEKREMKGGFGESPLRLNRSLRDATHWNADAIRTRAEELARKAADIWPAPEVSDESLVEYRELKYRRRKPKPDFGHFKMSDSTRRLFDVLIEGISDLGLEPTIWKYMIGMGKPGAGKPYPVIVRPRKSRILLGFPMPIEEIDDPPACAYGWESRRGEQRTRAKLETEDDVSEGLRLLETVLRYKAGELDSDSDDDDNDERNGGGEQA